MSLITDRPATTMSYNEAIDFAVKLAAKDSEWRYTVEVDACDPKAQRARIAVYDENEIKMGYL